MSTQPTLLACPQCDLLQRQSALVPGARAFCARCQAPLGKAPSDSHDRTLALAIAGLVMLLIAHLNPVFGIEVQGHEQSASLWQAAITLFEDDAWLLGILVLLTTLVFPALELIILCYLLVFLRQSRVPAGLPRASRWMQAVRPWVMVEVFMLGVLVAVVKLAGVANVLPGVGLWSFAAVMLLLASAAASFDPHGIWQETKAG